jgi:hypothetical protein
MPTSPAPPLHQAWLDAALPALEADPRLLAVGAGGSYLRRALDAWSDLDLVVLVDPGAYEEVLAGRLQVAESCGPCVSAFTAEHVGAPEMLIVLYGPPLLHVDLKFTTPERLAASRVEDPVILWERDGAMTAALARGAARWPMPDLQWIEDRFWAWVHYTACKIGRGELFEAMSALEFLRDRVLGPLATVRAGGRPQGQRRLEERCAQDLPMLERTVCGHDAHEALAALRAVVAHYLELREALAGMPLVRRTAARAAVSAFLDDVAASLRPPP